MFFVVVVVVFYEPVKCYNKDATHKVNAQRAVKLN